MSMDTVAAGRQLIDLLKLCYYSKRPPLLSGRHGVGKTEILQATADELGIELITRDLSLMEPPDLVGLPQIGETGTVYHPPSFLPRGGRGILVLEEVNRAERCMQAPCLQLLTARALNDYRLPTGWLPAAAVNPENDAEGYLVDSLDSALRSRFVCVEVVPDRREWLAWARRNGMHAQVVEYVESDPTVFDDAVSNPRSWTYVSDLLRAADVHGASTQSLRSAVLGQVGDNRGAAFLSLQNAEERPFAAEEVFANYATRRRAILRWIESGRLDLVGATMQNVLITLQPEGAYHAIRETAEEWTSLSSFLADLPGDFQKAAREFFSERAYQYPQLPHRTGLTFQ